MKAYELRKIDKTYNVHMQAWLNRLVDSTEKKGKEEVPVYKTFKDFFDYEAELKKVGNPENEKASPRMKKLARLASKVNKNN